MVEIVLILTLVVIIFILLLSLIMRALEKPEKLKTHSIVIVDTRGQHRVSESEFVQFMDRLESIFVNHRNHNDWNDELTKRNTNSSSNYIDPAVKELQSWVRNTDNYPLYLNYTIKDPMAEELEEINGESNPILMNNSNGSGSKSLDSSQSQEHKATLDDIAALIRQIKEINLQYPEEDRKIVKLTETHKLLTKLLKKYYDSVDSEMFEKSIDMLVKQAESLPTSAAFTAKMARNRDKEGFASSTRAVSSSRLNVVVDTSGFRDDDRVVSSRQSALDVNDANSAIETMLVKKSSGHAKLTGGRKHIML